MVSDCRGPLTQKSWEIGIFFFFMILVVYLCHMIVHPVSAFLFFSNKPVFGRGLKALILRNLRKNKSGGPLYVS